MIIKGDLWIQTWLTSEYKPCTLCSVVWPLFITNWGGNSQTSLYIIPLFCLYVLFTGDFKEERKQMWKKNQWSQEEIVIGQSRWQWMTEWTNENMYTTFFSDQQESGQKGLDWTSSSHLVPSHPSFLARQCRQTLLVYFRHNKKG